MGVRPTAYALRSYLYLLPHAAVARAAAFLLATDKRVAFYAVRCALGDDALCEARFAGAAGAAFGRRPTTLAFLLTAAGLFHASVAFLPSTFAMHCFLLSTALDSNRSPTTPAPSSASRRRCSQWPFAASSARRTRSKPPPPPAAVAFASGARRRRRRARRAGGAGRLVAVRPASLIAPLNILLYNRDPPPPAPARSCTASIVARNLQNLALNLNAHLPAAPRALRSSRCPTSTRRPATAAATQAAAARPLVLSGALLWLASAHVRFRTRRSGSRLPAKARSSASPPPSPSSAAAS